MSVEQPQFLYSQGTQDIGEARNFSWEYPVPNTDFWRDLPWNVSTGFLRTSSPEKVQQLPAHPDYQAAADGGKTAKLNFLNGILHEELEERDIAAATNDKTFFDADYTTWSALWGCISGIESQLGNLSEAERVMRMLHEKRQDPSSLMHQNGLAFLLLKRGEYAESERLNTEVREWLDQKLGKDSPQSLGARRGLIEAKWKQGPSRREDAERDVAEIRALIAGMGDGKYAVYQEVELKAVEELTQKLRENHV